MMDINGSVNIVSITMPWMFLENGIINILKG